MSRFHALVVALALFVTVTNAEHGGSAGIEVSRLLVTKDVKQLVSSGKGGGNGTGCGCKNLNCGCCAYLKVDKIGLNDTVCTNLTYLPDQYGVSLTISVDGKIYYNKTVSVKNPPPLCAEVPFLKKLASLCVEFYNLDVSKSKLSGCIRIIAELEYLVVGKYDLGCFKIPPGKDSVLENRGQHAQQKDTAIDRSASGDVRLKTTGCSCLYYDCGCCMDLGQSSFELAAAADNVCANLTFLTKTSEVAITLTVDKVIYFNKTVPVRNPPPICVHLPYLTSVDLCVQFYSLDIKQAQLTGCLRILSEIDGKVMESFDLGCFKFPSAVTQTPSRLNLIKDNARPSGLENLMFLAYEEAKKERMFDKL